MLVSKSFGQEDLLLDFCWVDELASQPVFFYWKGNNGNTKFEIDEFDLALFP